MYPFSSILTSESPISFNSLKSLLANIHCLSELGVVLEFGSLSVSILT